MCVINPYCTHVSLTSIFSLKKEVKTPSIDAYGYLCLLFNIGRVRTYIKPPEAITHT